MSTEIINNIQQRAGSGRSFPQKKTLTTDNSKLTSDGETAASSTFSQNPEEIQNQNSFQFSSSNALWFPEDLGTTSNAYYVKFDVFLLDNEGSREKVRGDSKRTVGFDESGKPRFVTNTKFAGHDRNGVFGITPSLKRLNEVIALPMPDSVVSDHSTSWSRAEGGLVSSVLSFGDGLAHETGDAMVRAGKAATLKAASGITGLMSQLDLDGAQTHLKLLTKRATNPRNEFLFDGVNNRSFNFQWKLIPKSVKEAKQVKNILDKFKLYLYPELDSTTAGNFYLFPAMFDITFMRGSVENEFLYRTSTCALTNMTINHASAGQWVGTHDLGAPIAYDIIMQFTEAEFLHRDRFKSETNPEGVAR